MQKKYRFISIKNFLLVWSFPVGALVLLAMLSGRLAALLSLESLTGLAVLALLGMASWSTYAVIDGKDLLIVKSAFFRTRIPISEISSICALPGMFGIWNLEIKYDDDKKSTDK
jgi:hypothetical protein